MDVYESEGELLPLYDECCPLLLAYPIVSMAEMAYPITSIMQFKCC